MELASLKQNLQNLFRNGSTTNKEDAPIIKEDLYIDHLAYETTLFHQFGKNQDCNLPHIRMLIITDTHDRLYYDQKSIDLIQNAECDVCFILGDVSPDDINIILEYIPREKIYGLLGNHDSWDTLEVVRIPNIHGKVISVKGVKIVGFQGSFRYKNGDFPMYTQEESLEIAEKIPEADILVSHDKPYTKDCENISHNGLKGITYYCYKNHIKLVIHGHLHEKYEDRLLNGTKVVCEYKVTVIET